MAVIVVTAVNPNSALNSELGVFTRKVRLNVSGLTAPGANSIPHGLTDIHGNPVAPQRVIPVPYNATAQAAQAVVTLDGTNGGNVSGGGANGWDATNIYVVTGTSVTQAAFEIDGY